MPAATKPSTGVDALLKVNTGTDASPVWTAVGAQRNATLKVNNKPVDITSKDGNGWEANISGLSSWGVDCDGLYIDGDAAQQLLETAILTQAYITIELLMPSGKMYAGEGAITSWEVDAPHDKELGYKLSIQGNGALTATPAV